MNRELEALILAREAELEAASGQEAKQLRGLYEARLDDVLQRFPKLSRATLERMVERAHWRWSKAQDKPSSMPPQA